MNTTLLCNRDNTPTQKSFNLLTKYGCQAHVAAISKINSYLLAILELIHVIAIRVRFAQTQYTGSEATGVVMVTLELVGGTSNHSFNVTVTPSEQSPVSAEGNSILCMIVC